ncbi:MAG: hypothetical protein ACTSVZ_08815 [Promethearchaeota archaeon]
MSSEEKSHNLAQNTSQNLMGYVSSFMATPWGQWLIPLAVVTLVAGLLTLIPVWQFVILAGLIGGILASKRSIAFLAGFFGTCIAWGMYFWIMQLRFGSGVIPLQFSTLIFGDASLGSSFWFIFSLVGGLIGGSAGWLGYILKSLFFPQFLCHDK